MSNISKSTFFIAVCIIVALLLWSYTLGALSPSYMTPYEYASTHDTGCELTVDNGTTYCHIELKTKSDNVYILKGLQPASGLQTTVEGVY